MVESYTRTEHVYTCTIGCVVLREETGSVTIQVCNASTNKPERVEEFGKLLCDVAITMRNL